VVSAHLVQYRSQPGFPNVQILWGPLRLICKSAVELHKVADLLPVVQPRANIADGELSTGFTPSLLLLRALTELGIAAPNLVEGITGSGAR
jgi:hypothetical protein